MPTFADLRKRTGLSVAELVRDLGESPSRLEIWESGAEAAPIHVMRALEVLRVNSNVNMIARAKPAFVPVAQQSFGWPILGKSTPSNDARSGSFADNMKLPVHRWFRYSAGFSGEWVRAVIDNRGRSDERLFDPFAGSGTALLAAKAACTPSFGIENHPFIHRIASAKLNTSVDLEELRARAERLVGRARQSAPKVAAPSPLLAKCYTPDALTGLHALREAFLEDNSGDSISELLWLALTSILRECSGVGTAQWQYVLPNKSKARVAQPLAAFSSKIEQICYDLSLVRSDNLPDADLRLGDARNIQAVEFDERDRATLVITSPPYPNNYDYADATRLEMTFWGEVSGWGDLQSAVRKNLIRSCSQHSAAEKLQLGPLLAAAEIAPIRDELTDVCESLAEIRETKGGKKTYHTMVAAYFVDLAKTWESLRSVCANGADVCFVIGDSAPYGVYVPVDRWLTKLALAAGFSEPRFEKIRDRNVKWKNRKHRVPLQEGRLWLRA